MASKRVSLNDFEVPGTSVPANSIGKKPSSKSKVPEPGIESKLRGLTVRLDVDRWLRLREFALRDGRSASRIIIDLLDEYLDDPAKKRPAKKS